MPHPASCTATQSLQLLWDTGGKGWDPQGPLWDLSLLSQHKPFLKLGGAAPAEVLSYPLPQGGLILLGLFCFNICLCKILNTRTGSSSDWQGWEPQGEPQEPHPELAVGGRALDAALSILPSPGKSESISFVPTLLQEHLWGQTL